jgi:hypothetical protein
MLRAATPACRVAVAAGPGARSGRVHQRLRVVDDVGMPNSPCDVVTGGARAPPASASAPRSAPSPRRNGCPRRATRTSRAKSLRRRTRRKTSGARLRDRPLDTAARGSPSERTPLRVALRPRARTAPGPRARRVDRSRADPVDERSRIALVAVRDHVLLRAGRGPRSAASRRSEPAAAAPRSPDASAPQHRRWLAVRRRSRVPDPAARARTVVCRATARYDRARERRISGGREQAASAPRTRRSPAPPASGRGTPDGARTGARPTARPASRREEPRQTRPPAVSVREERIAGARAPPS